MLRGLLRRFSDKVLTLESIGAHVKDAQYAVRGDVVLRADEISAKIRVGDAFPFKELTQCNIGNPHYMGQKSLTWVRQGLSFLINPEMLSIPNIKAYYPPDIIERCEYLLSRITGGLGAYSESQGLLVVRESIAKYIEQRDQIGQCSPTDIFVNNGASPAIDTVLSCTISSKNDGIMIPIPQYPLYSALITLKQGRPVGYYMDSSDAYWKLSINEMQTSLEAARGKGINVKAIVVINPGNPTGQVLSVDNIKRVIEFCDRNRLALFADEVYQDNVYHDQKVFCSFRKAARELNASTEIISFQSLSKGFYGECGLRGGYMDLLNIDAGFKSQILKLVSIMLCSSTIGQLGLELVLNPPKPSQPSYITFIKEKTDILASLKRKAKIMQDMLNSMENMQCNYIEGAMYAMPCVSFSNKAIKKAAELGMEADKFYVMQALEKTGIVLVPGSGFGQKPGTSHFRITILSPEEGIVDMLQRFKAFNNDFHKQYKD